MERLNIARGFVYDAPARVILPPPLPSDCPGSQPQQNRETRTMLMITEKAFALVLAVAFSGAAFQTFIV